MNTLTLIVLAGIVLALLVLGLLAIRRVPIAQSHVVKRLGRFHRTLEPGWHFIVPLFDRIAHRISLTGRVVEVSFDVTTSDHVQLVASGLVYFQVLDPDKAVKRAEALNQGAKNLAEAITRAFVGEVARDALRHRTGREINDWLLGLMNESAQEWGVRITRLDLAFKNLPGDSGEAGR